MAKLGEYVRIRTGKLDANASSENGKYPFFTCAIEPLKIDSYSYDCECVLVAGNGDLNVKYYYGKFDAYQRTYIIESNDKQRLDTRYLYYFLDKYLGTLRKQSIGGVIKYIKLENLTNADIPMCDLEVQKKIIRIMDCLELLILKQKKQLKKLDLLVKSQFIEMFGDPVTNPKNWTTKKLQELGTLSRGLSKHRPRNAPELLGGPYPLIQTGDVANADGYIKKYTSTYSELGFKQSKMWPKDTLCITIAANIAKTAILEFASCFPDSIVGFNAYSEVTNEYIHHWFTFVQKILEEQAPESAQKNINLKILSELQVMVPDKKSQAEYTAFLKKVDKSKLVIQQSLEKLEILKKSLMQEYFG